MFNPTLLSLLIAFTITCLILVAVRPLAIRIGLVDTPDHRKMHQGKIPLIGGIGMFGGFVFASLALSISLQPYRTLFAAGGLLVFLGILDDFHELSPKARLFGQLLAAAMVVWGGGIYLADLGHVFYLTEIILPPWLGYGVSIFAIMSLINAFNMLDGLDGLAGLVALIGALGFMSLTLYAGDYSTSYLIGLVVMVILAFLLFNWRWKKKARVFMGDAGSMFLGLAFAWFAIYCSQFPHQSARPVVMLWILAVPLFELMAVIIFRLLQRRSPLQAGRDHMHYLLLNYFQSHQWSNTWVVVLVGIFALFSAMIGFLAEVMKWPENVMFWSFMCLFIIYMILRGWLQMVRSERG